MEINIKIAVIGSTGKAGTYLAKQLAKQNIPFRALVRNPESPSTTTHEIIEGNVSNYSSVLSLLQGCTAVISMLGMGTSQNPTTIFTTSTANILRAMEECGIRRYIVITGLNVDTIFDSKGEKSKLATGWMLTNYPETTKNKQQEYELLSQSNADWTMIRLPIIVQTDNETDIIISTEDCPGDSISATSLAKFVIEQLTDDSYIRKAPFIADR